MFNWYLALIALVIWLAATLLYLRKYIGPWLAQRRKARDAARQKPK